MSLALDYLREIGTVADLRAAADRRGGGIPVMANNAHLHLPPNFSAFTTVAQAMELADAQNCRIVGASNYYDCHAYHDLATSGRQWNIFPLYGLEIICMLEDLRVAGIRINDPVNPGKMYICGKGIVKFGNMSPEATRIFDQIRSGDAARMRSMVERLSKLLAERGLSNSLDAEAVIDRVVQRHAVPRETVFLQERHVAQCLQEYLFAQLPAPERLARLQVILGAAPKMKSPEDAVGLQNELRSQLMKVGKPGYVAETFIDFAPAMKLIGELGGFASYPILADANNPLCPFEDPAEKLVQRLQERNIHAAELITGRNNRATVLKFAQTARAAGIIMTAGTEHNTLEMIPFAPVCLRSEPLPLELQALFYEGACVIAAHQFLVAHGEVGYVDADGNLNAEYADAEARIAAFERIGDAVIRRYLNRVGR